MNGEDMRIVALHGQVGIASDWDSLGTRLCRAGHELDAVDLWSYLEDGELEMAEFGEVINERDAEVLLGYSMGGRLALHALVAEPDRWKMAVIVSAHGGLAETERDARRLVDDEWVKKVRDLPWVEFLRQWNGQGVLGDNVMPDRSVLESRRSEVARSFKCWSLAEQEVLLEMLKAVKIPVLFVVGSRDTKFLNQWDGVGKVMERAEVRVMSDAGHRVPWEAEAEFADVMDAFIKRSL